MNDDEVIGKWDVVGYALLIEDFNPEVKSQYFGPYLTSLVFISDGMPARQWNPM